MTASKLCPQCGRTYTDADRFCTVDGATLLSSGTSESLIGAVLAERYLVQERLGEGGMGEVYLAEHVRMKRKVAVKVMRKWMAGDPLAVSRFHREAENASQITHPNVAQVYDFGETADGTMYLAMEYVPGEPLSAILHREGRLNAVRAAEIVRQTADALVAAHGMGILHRDLKPDNVMVARARTGADIVKLVDFGIARVMSRGTQQFTSTGMIVGTPDYMSPEQLAGDTLDERSDLYALALIAFRALTGGGAFPEGATGEALIARLTNKARKLEQVLVSVQWPASLQAAFDRALDSDPANRFADALEFAAELDGAVSQMPLTDDEQAYLVLLSQRSATPTRVSAIHDAMTPIQAMRAASIPTPTTGQRSVALQTPPSEERAVPVPEYLRRSTADFSPTDRTPTGNMPAAPPADMPADDAPPHAMPHLAAAQPPTAAAQTPTAAQTPSTAQAPLRRTSRGPLVVAGIAALLAVAYFANTRLASAPDSSAPIVGGNADRPNPVAAPRSPVVDSTIPPAGRPVNGRVLADTIRLVRAKAGVLQVVSSLGRGSAIVVDPLGILLTASSLIPSNQGVEVFVDADHTVRASVLSVDRTNGLAALLIAPTTCTRCRSVLDLGAGDSSQVTLAVGDSLVALPASGRTSVARAGAALGKLTPRTFALVSPLGPSSLGTPLVAPATGQVVGLATSRKGGATASTLRTLLATARTAARTTVANDTLYRSWPAVAVADRDLSGAESMAPSALQVYSVEQGGFRVLAMTPRVLAWRSAQSPPPGDVPANIFAIEAPSATHADPISEWSEWGAYRTERRAVVIFDIAPKDAAFPAHPTKLLDWKKGDFYSMTLKRDGQLLVPLASQRVPAVANQEAYRKDGKARIPNSGVYVFHPVDFVPVTAQYTMEVVDAEKLRRVNIVLPAAMLEAIAKELGPWQKP